MKQFLTALALTGLLAVSAAAGDISTSGSPAPGSNGSTASAVSGERPTSGAATTSTEPGEIPSGDVADQISDEALSALLSVISFL